MKKITKRTVYETLIKVANGEDFTQYITAEDLRAFAENEIGLLDKRADRSKAKAAEKKAEGDALRDVVQSVLTDEYQTIADVAAQIEGEDITVGKVRNRLSELVRLGAAEKNQVEMEVDGKKKTVYDEVEKEIKKDNPARLHARRQMLKMLYPVTEVPAEPAGRKRNTKSVDIPAKLFDEIAPKYANRNGGYTRIIKIGQRRGDGAMEVVLELV